MELLRSGCGGASSVLGYRLPTTTISVTLFGLYEIHSNLPIWTVWDLDCGNVQKIEITSSRYIIGISDHSNGSVLAVVQTIC